MNKRKIAEGIAKFRLRHTRGRDLLGFVIELIKNIVYLGAAGYFVSDWFHIFIPKYVLILFAVFYELICYFLGYFDEHVGFWKFENRYAAKELNPFLSEINDKIDNLHGRKL